MDVPPIDARNGKGLQFGDHSVQQNFFGPVRREAPRQARSPLPYALSSLYARDALLGELHERIRKSRPGGHGPTRVLLHGTPGVGKSALAAAFARRYGGEYGVVWWVPAHDTAEAMSAFVGLATQLDMTSAGDGTDPVGTVQTLLAARDDPWLLLFDDVPDIAVLDGLIPSDPRGDVVITSRNPHLGRPDVALKVPGLSAEDASEFLCHRTGSDDRRNARRLAEDLGGLPIALEQAATFVVSASGALDLAGYVRLLRERQVDVLSEGLPGEYVPQRRTVVSTFALALEALPPPARALMRLLVCFAPQRVPLFMLKAASADEAPCRIPDTSELPLDALEHSVAMAGLTAYSLVHTEPAPDGSAVEVLSLHTLVRAVVLATMTAAETVDLRAVARQLVRRVTPPHPEDPATWKRYGLLVPHIRAVADHETLHEDEAYWRAATYLEGRGDSRTASLLWREIEAAARRFHGEEDPRRLAAAGNLAISLAGTGQVAEAAALERQVLDACFIQLGKDHPQALVAMGNLAIRRAALGDLAGAEALERAVLAGRRQVLGDRHPHTLLAMGNLAIRRAALGDLSEAESLERTVLRVRRSLGDERAIAHAMTNVAATLAASGDFLGAADLEYQVLRIRRRLLGNEHPHTLQTMSNLAGHLVQVGAMVEAIEIIDPVIDAFGRLRGVSHRDTLSALGVQAIALAATGRVREAAAIQRRILDRHRSLSAAHPDTCRAMGNLANSLSALGNLDAAVELEREALAGFERVLGRDHVDTLSAVDNLAASLAATNDLPGAVELQARALDGYRRVFGDGHARTVRARQNLDRWRRLAAARHTPPGTP